MQQKNDKNPSFLEPKTLIAVAAVAIVYFGWNTYLQKKYPDYGKNTPAQSQVATSPTPGSSSAELAEGKVTKPVDGKSEVVTQNTEQTFQFSNDKVSFALTSHGMGLKNYTINNYQDKEKNNIRLGVSENTALFEMRWAGDDKALNFNITEQSPGHYLGKAQVGSTTITRELKFNTENSSFTNTITVENPGDEFKKGFTLLIPEAVHAKGSSSFFFPSYEHQDFFVVHNGGKHETINFNNAKEDVNKSLSTASVLSVSSQYFAAAILDKSEILPEVKVTSSVVNHSGLAELTYKPVNLTPEMKFNEIFYAGPKSIDALNAVDPAMADIIDFGFFSFIAKPLLYVMKASHAVVGNWGFAIIILTLLVRLCVLPFNIMSFKSMKAMQKVQPIIANLREKYKDDPMRLNTEMMAVMKQNGANPIGGCLPMLLQIPVFFALYRVIGSSIELYSSPFVLWIHDLSAHDPFYVLPVLMAVFMFVQQKITPTTMDPTQAKIMLFLPVVFSLFMLQLPAGLTLYMVVSTLFGIIQQYIMMRDRTPASAAVINVAKK
ncbi:membrane protein insertase [Bdellovibrio bacteriovorus]|uniref:Membrane protein insertase YidC n=1 Tax=Bdellovibrio bacteriovorus TaxID=959 RepID=A0A150WQK8_BDEBC|nr:membrane protein insertase YidC [Bdellovibrio bacteriovorus]KYG66710.1 membrane protein insertase [Bdellovibrio bacteriovorus]